MNRPRVHDGRVKLTRLGSVIAAALTGAALASLISAPASAAPLRESAVVRTSLTACPTTAPAGSLWGSSRSIGARRLCEQAVARAATPQARAAIREAFAMLGAPYACAGAGRMDRFRFDCSSLVSRAYFRGAGIPAAGTGWASSTRDMMPWDGRRLAPWARYVAPSAVRPGDLVLYDTGASLSRHVVMYIGGGWMLHTNACGSVAHVEPFWGFGRTGSHRFVVARRVVMPPAGTPAPVDLSRTPAARAATVSLSRLLARDKAAAVRVQVALNAVTRVGLQVDGRWDGGLQSDIVGFRRTVMGYSRSDAVGPPDMTMLRALGKRAGFTAVR